MSPKLLQKVPKMEPTSVSGANFLDFGRTVFSCNTTVVWPYFKGPGGHGTVQKRRQKVLWKRIAEKVTEIPGKYRKVRQKSSPGGSHWSQKVTKNRLKSMPGPPWIRSGPLSGLRGSPGVSGWVPGHQNDIKNVVFDTPAAMKSPAV